MSVVFALEAAKELEEKHEADDGEAGSGEHDVRGYVPSR